MSGWAALQRRQWWVTLLLAAAASVCAALILRALFAVPYPCNHDDGFIAFRYAKNLAEGNGLVFNVGERVWGFTSPLTVLLLGALASVGISIEWASLVLGATSSAISSMLVWQLLRNVVSPFVALGAAVFVLTSKTSFSFLELEAQELIALQMLFLVLLMAKRANGAAFVGALACLTRPDSVVLVLPALLMLRNTRRQRPLAIFVFPGLAWLLFAMVYYHDWLPNSLRAKQGSAVFTGWIANFVRQLDVFPFADHSMSLDRFAPRFLALTALLNIVVTLGLLLEARLREQMVLVVVLLAYPWLLGLAYAVIGPPIGHNWEFQSPMFFNQLGFVVGILVSVDWLCHRTKTSGVRVVAQLLCLSAIGWLSIVNLRAQLGRVTWAQDYYWLGARHKAYLAVASWANAHLPPGSRVSFGEPGTIGFYSRLQLIDLGRIVTKAEPAEAPEYALEMDDVETANIWSHGAEIKYRRVQFFPANGYRALSMLRRINP